MAKDIPELYERMQHSRWTEIEDLTDLLLLYDSALTAVAGWYVRGKIDEAPGIPGPDAKWCLAAMNLPRKSTLSVEEKEFLDYFAVAEELRIALKQARDAHRGNVTTALSLSPIEATILYDAVDDYYGLWRFAWDMLLYFPHHSEDEVQGEVKTAIRHLLSRDWIAVYQSNLLSSNARTPPRKLTNAEVGARMLVPKNWEPPEYGSTEILIAATEGGMQAVTSYDAKRGADFNRQHRGGDSNAGLQ